MSPREWERAVAGFLTIALLGLVLFSTFTVGVTALTGFSFFFHSDSYVLQMTPTDF
jgi:hypothetical protein